MIARCHAPIDRVLEKLDARQSGDQWSARCPAHDDRNASLSISEGDDGRVLLKCHAGCDAKDVVSRMGMESRELFAPGSRSASQNRMTSTKPSRSWPNLQSIIDTLHRQLGGKLTTYEYVDSEHDVVGCVVRCDIEGRKDIRPVAKIGGAWQIKAMPVPRPIYRMTAVQNSRQVVVVEGEKCADRLASNGLAATTSAGGAKAASKTDWSPMAGKDVVILPDCDVAGRDYAKEASQRIIEAGAGSVRIVDLELASGDVVDWLDAGHTVDELLDLAAQAPEELPEDDEPEAHEAPLSPFSRPFLPVGEQMLFRAPEPRQYLLSHPDGAGLLPLGKPGLLTSSGGVGKTMVLIDMAISLVTGRPWLNHFTTNAPADAKVLLLLAEEDQEEVHRRLYATAAAMNLTDVERRQVAERVVAIPFFGERVGLVQGGNDECVTAENFDCLMQNLAHDKWAMIGLDPLSRFAGVSIDKDTEAGTFVMSLFERVTVETGATVLIASHSSKVSRREGSADVRGVTALTDAARWVGSLVADNERVKFQQVKSNYSKPMTEPLVLVREQGGCLRAERSDESVAETCEDDIDEDLQRILTAIAAMGHMSSKDAACRKAKIKLTKGRAAFTYGLDSGQIVNDGTDRKPSYRVRDVAGTTRDVGTMGARGRPPHTPPDDGTTSFDVPGTSAGAAPRDGDDASAGSDQRASA